MAITLDGNNANTVGVINSKTAVASTSGTSIDFTSIPAGVKRITVMFSGVSTNGTSNLLIQAGTSGGFTTSGYTSSAYRQNVGGGGGTTSTAGYVLEATPGAGASASRNFIASITNIASNTWVQSAIQVINSELQASSGVVSLSGTLDRVRITTVNGTDTFDAGSINILYE